MSYKSPIASATDYGVIKVGTGLSVTDGVVSGLTGILNYGFITTDTTQTNPVANDVNITTFTTASPANGVSIVGGNAITVANAGIYTKLFTLTVSKTAGGTSVISVWLRYNGADLPGSRQDLELSGTLNEMFVSGNFTLNMAAGSNIQLCWSSADVTVGLAVLPAAITPTRPTGYAAKVTLTRIS